VALTASMLLGSKLPNGTNRYVALLTTLPNAVGEGAVEVSGSGYVRVAHSTWIDKTEDGVTYRQNDGVIEFPTLSAAVADVVGWGVFNDDTAGDLVAWGPIVNADGDPIQKSFRENDVPRFLPQELSFSTDAADPAWASLSVEANAWRDICWSPELELFVAVSSDGTNRVMTSTDGVTWTPRTAASASSWNGVCWSPELGLFVAVADAVAACMTSPDGINWTTRTIGAALKKVCWSPSLTLFCAVGGLSGTEQIYTSPDGITWSSRSVSTFQATLNDVVWVEELSLFIAVGDCLDIGAGAVTVAITSPDGINWTKRNYATTLKNGVCWSPVLGLLVACGSTTFASSPDGIAWTNRSVPSGTWNSVEWSDALCMFVSVSSTGTDRVLVSADGIDWTVMSAAEANQWRAVCAVDNTIIALSSSGTNRAMSLTVSCDGTAEIDCIDELSAPGLQALLPPGLAWVRDVDTILTSFVRAISYSFARVRRRALDLIEEIDPRTTYEMLEDWERVYGLPDECAQPTTLSGRRAALQGKMLGNVDPNKENIEATATELGYDILIYEYKRAQMMTCESTCDDYLYTDQWMFHWTVSYWPGAIDAQLDCAIEQIVPNHTYALFNVRSWTPGDVSVPSNSVWRSVCWSPTCRKFVAVATSGTDSIMTSAEGRYWTARTAPAANLWICVIWAEEIGLFVAVATNGTNRAMTSPDGVVWSSSPLTTASQWQSVAFSPALSRLIAVASTGTNRVAYSDDGGTSWTDGTAAEANSWQSVCWSPELNLFVAVASSGTNRVMTSPDGITWTARSAAEANTWQCVCWSAELGLFVACSLAGTHRFMTSPDGITWSTSVHPENAQYRSVIWVKELDAFVAMALDGSGSAFSRDGIAWSALSVGEANNWYSVAWSPEQAILIAVASNGTNRVARIREQGGRRFYRAIE